MTVRRAGLPSSIFSFLTSCACPRFKRPSIVPSPLPNRRSTFSSFPLFVFHITRRATAVLWPPTVTPPTFLSYHASCASVVPPSSALYLPQLRFDYSSLSFIRRHTVLQLCTYTTETFLIHYSTTTTVALFFFFSLGEALMAQFFIFCEPVFYSSFFFFCCIITATATNAAILPHLSCVVQHARATAVLRFGCGSAATAGSFRF